MKLRCVQNSIRLRLRKSDINILSTRGILKEEVCFPGSQVFTFSLSISNHDTEVCADFEGLEMKVILPEQIAKAWVDSNQVGIERYIDLPTTGNQLHILVEKDFPCKDRENEDKADTYTELAGPHC